MNSVIDQFTVTHQTIARAPWQAPRLQVLDTGAGTQGGITPTTFDANTFTIAS